VISTLGQRDFPDAGFVVFSIDPPLCTYGLGAGNCVAAIRRGRPRYLRRGLAEGNSDLWRRTGLCGGLSEAPRKGVSRKMTIENGDAPVPDRRLVLDNNNDEVR
jgi:hypothetical protein